MTQSTIRNPLARWWFRVCEKPKPATIPQPPVARVVPKPLFNPRVPVDVMKNVENACIAGKWMVAIWRVENGKVFLDRTATNFPASDIDQAMRMIVEDVQQLKAPPA